jgi:MurNAc alpha-1-phosphate uridylyltransferase
LPNRYNANSSKLMLPIAILAGGLATRLGSITTSRPKALIPILNRPFVEWQLELLSSQGLQKVIFCVGHLGSQIEEIIGDGSKFKLNVLYSYDGHNLLGTGGALKRALPLLGKEFFVTYGDSYLQTPLEPIEVAFRDRPNQALMVVYKNDNIGAISNAKFERGLVTRYAKTERVTNLQYIDFGLQILTSEVFQPYADDEPFDLGIVFAALAAKKELAGFEVNLRFFEIGSIEGIQNLEKYLKDRSDHELC